MRGEDRRHQFLADWPQTQLVDDVAGNEFKAVVPRQVTEQVGALLARLDGEMTRQAIQALRLSHREHFRAAYLVPALKQGLIEMAQPDNPNSRSQRYRLTTTGRQWLAARTKELS